MYLSSMTMMVMKSVLIFSSQDGNSKVMMKAVESLMRRRKGPLIRSSWRQKHSAC